MSYAVSQSKLKDALMYWSCSRKLQQSGLGLGILFRRKSGQHQVLTIQSKGGEDKQRGIRLRREVIRGYKRVQDKSLQKPKRGRCLRGSLRGFQSCFRSQSTYGACWDGQPLFYNAPCAGARCERMSVVTNDITSPNILRCHIATPSHFWKIEFAFVPYLPYVVNINLTLSSYKLLLTRSFMSSSYSVLEENGILFY